MTAQPVYHPKLEYLIRDPATGKEDWVEASVIRDRPASEIMIVGSRHAWFCQCSECPKGSPSVIVKW